MVSRTGDRRFSEPQLIMKRSGIVPSEIEVITVNQNDRPLEEDTMKKLYRSREHCQIAGVAGGVAQYFNVDPLLVRLTFIILGLSAAPGIIIYAILWVLVPKEPTLLEEFEDSKTSKL
ncbi:MAG: PspC domain-containing protein [Limnospira maxima]|nr:PspC domain-containing protein [Limnospira indica]